MSQGFRVEKRAEKTIVKFQDLEMVPGKIETDAGDAIQEIREAGILGSKYEGEGFGEFTALILPKEGKWPELEGMPPVIKEVFQKALEDERKRNADADSFGCCLTVKVQGDVKAQESRFLRKRAVERGGNPEDVDMHFDGSQGLDVISEYLVSFSGPTTIQYVGEADLSLNIQHETEIRSALASVAPSKLRPASILPKYLYHITGRTPHSEPTTLDTLVSNRNPRLFMRFVFGKIDKEMAGRVYEPQ